MHAYLGNLGNETIDHILCKPSVAIDGIGNTLVQNSNKSYLNKNKYLRELCLPYQYFVGVDLIYHKEKML